MPDVTYSAFCDPTGGVNDAMTLAAGHLERGEMGVLAALLEVRPPFYLTVAVAECVALLRRFGVTRAASERWGGEWVKARFAEQRIEVEHGSAEVGFGS